MTIPLQLPQTGTTGVLQDPLQEQLMRFLLAGMENAQRQQQLQLDKEALKLRKQEQASRISEQAMQQQQLGQLGEALRPALLAGETAPFQIPQFNPALGPLAGFQATAVTPIGQAVAQAPAAILPAFAGETRDIRAQLAKQRTELAAEQDFQQFLKGAKPEHRRALLGMRALANADITTTEGERATLFPELAQALQVVSPQDLNAMTSFMARTGATFGQARHALSKPPIPGIPDNLRAPQGMLRPRETEQTAAGLLSIMEQNYPIITATIEAAGGGITLPTAFFVQLRKNVPVTDIINNVIKPEQRQVTYALLRFVNALRFAVSGKQTTNQEFLEFLTTSVPFANDDPESRQQKLAALQANIDAVRTMAGGAARPSVVLERMLRTARLQGWNQNLINAFERQLEDAKRWEANTRRQQSLYVDPSPTDSTNFDLRLRQWDSVLPP